MSILEKEEVAPARDESGIIWSPICITSSELEREPVILEKIRYMIMMAKYPILGTLCDSEQTFNFAKCLMIIGFV